MRKPWAVDSAGNHYVAGVFNGATLVLGATTLTKIGTQDAFVAKLNASGTVLWVKNFGGSGASVYANAIAVDASGNVYVGGSFAGANLTAPALSLIMIGSRNAFAFKLDSSGATTWAKNFGGAGALAEATGIAVDASGNVVLGGYFMNADLTAPALTNIGAVDAFVFKLDSNGFIIWSKNFGGAGAGAYAMAIAADASGNVYLAGFFESASLTTPALTRIGNSDAFAFKLDSSGAITCANNYGGSGAIAIANGIAADGSGNVYLGGSFNGASLTAPTLTRIGSKDAFALKLADNGTTIWSKNYGGVNASADVYGVAVDASGNVVLGGYFNGANLTTPALTKIGFGDAFAFKLDSSGATIWSTNYGGAGANTFANAIAADASGSVVLGGRFQNTSLTTPALTLIGNQDAFLLKSATPPSAPTGVSASAGNGQATVSFSAPANGGSAITGYTVVSSPAGGVDSNAGSAGLSHTITGIANGTAYTFTVTATNAIGASPASAVSATVTPSAPVIPAPSYDPGPPAPTTTTVAPGGSATLGSLPVVSQGGATVTVPKDASGGKVTLQSGGAPTSLVLGDAKLSATPLGGTASFSVQAATHQGKPVLVIQVTSGSASFSVPPGLTFLSLEGATTSAGAQGAEVTVQDGKLVISGGSVTLNADGNIFAADATLTAYAGEIVEKDANGKLRVRVGSASGNDGAVGDPFKSASMLPNDSLPTAVNLGGKLGRLGDLSPLDLLGKLAQAPIQQNSDGTLGSIIHGLPVSLRIEAGRADGVQGFELANNGLVIRVLPLPADLNAFAKQSATTLTMDGDGILHVSGGRKQYAGRAAYLIASTTADGFSTDAQGNLVWANNGSAQTIYPAFGQPEKLKAALLALDPQATLTDSADGNYSASLKGQRYQFRPDFELLNLAAHRSDAWWVEGSKVFINYGNATAQGFAVK